MKPVAIYFVRFTSQYEMAATFMRFQEYFESPKFRGKIFTREEFMDWYARQKGRFTYFEDWSGFNIPGRILRIFYRGKFHPLTQKEEKLLRAFRQIKGNFYIIAALKTDAVTLRHEIVHALFYMNANYQKAVVRCFRQYNIAKLRRAIVRSNGYHPDLALDELNAYILTGMSALNDIRGKDVRTGLRKGLKRLFLDHFSFPIWRKDKQFLLNLVQLVRL